jgi:hypothetical protein
MSPICEKAEISSDAFLALTVRAERLEAEALEMDFAFNLLGCTHSYQTKPEGSIERVANRLRAIADNLDRMVAKADEARVATFIYSEAAE